MTVEVTLRNRSQHYYPDVSDVKVDQGFYIIQQYNMMTRVPIDRISFVQEFNY